MHGRLDRVRKDGKRVAVEADQSQVLRVEMPDWRIVDDVAWFTAQKIMETKAEECLRRNDGEKGFASPGAKFPLSALAKCGTCGGGISLGHTKVSGGTRVRAYTCTFHWKRGKAVCPVKILQPREEVESALADHLLGTVIPALGNLLLEEIRAEAKRQLAAPTVDTEAMEDELRRLRAEQKNLTSVVAAGGGDIPEVVKELKVRGDRIRHLEANIVAVRRTPAIRAEALAKVEEAALAKLEGLRVTLESDPEGAREVYRSLFPEGLRFFPAENQDRRVWRITGSAKLGGPTCLVTPPGIEPGFAK